MDGAGVQQNYPNPYIIGNAIDEPEKFFGRESLFNFLEDNLNQNVRLILLHGQRRIGKSSVLKQIPNFVAREDFFFVNFDIQDTGRFSLGVILHRLGVEITEQLAEYLDQDLDDLQIPPGEDLETNTDLFGQQFLPQIYRELGTKNLVLLLDEFDVLNNSSAVEDKHFFVYLKSLLKHQEKLFVIPVVGRHLDDMPKMLHLFKEAPHQEIGLLDELSARRLITNPAQGVLHYEHEAVQAILELCAGHPYFTQVLCFTIFSRARDANQWRVTRNRVEQVIDQAIDNAQAGLVWFWDGLPIPEQVVFTAVAEAQAQAIQQGERLPEDPLNLLGKSGVVPTESLLKAANQLTEKGFLDNTGRRVKVKLVHLWLLQRHPLQQEIWQLEKIEHEEIQPLGETAHALLAKGKQTNALAIYEQILILNPNHFRTLFALADVYLHSGQFERALELYHRAYQVDPLHEQERLLQGLETYAHTLLTQKKIAQAKAQYERVLTIAPQRISAQQRLREIEVFTSQSLGWFCQGYQNAPHAKVQLESNQSCPICGRKFSSSLHRPWYRSKRNWLSIAATLGIVAFAGLGVDQFSSPCSAGEQRVGIRCIKLAESEVSYGERTLFPIIGNLERDLGIEAFGRGNYDEAARLFDKAVMADRNDPEVLIYYHNALARQQGNPFTLAVVVPAESMADGAAEILRGVAQAQKQFNNAGGLNGRLLEIAIANDNNEPAKSQQIAQQLAEDPAILGVIGHNGSNASKAALTVYEQAGLVMISPTSTSTLLSGDVFFRTVPSDAASGKELAQYTRTTLGLDRVVIFYSPDSLYSNSLREEFSKQFERLGGKVLRKIDLSSPTMDAEKEIPRSVFGDLAQAALLFPDTQYTSVALELARANYELITNPRNLEKQGLKLLGGDSLYSFTTLSAGGAAVEGLVVAVPWFAQAEQSQDFAQAAIEQWGGTVSWRTATSFDATKALIAALSANPSRSTVLQRVKQVQLQAQETAGESLRFTNLGERRSEPILVEVIGGKFELEGS